MLLIDGVRSVNACLRCSVVLLPAQLIGFLLWKSQSLRRCAACSTVGLLEQRGQLLILLCEFLQFLHINFASCRVLISLGCELLIFLLASRFNGCAEVLKGQISLGDWLKNHDELSLLLNLSILVLEDSDSCWVSRSFRLKRVVGLLGWLAAVVLSLLLTFIQFRKAVECCVGRRVWRDVALLLG